MLTLGTRAPVFTFGAMEVGDNSSDEFEHYNNDLDSPAENGDTAHPCIHDNCRKSKMEENKVASVHPAPNGKQVPRHSNESDDDFAGFNELFVTAERESGDKLNVCNSDCDTPGFLQGFGGLFDDDEEAQSNVKPFTLFGEPEDTASDSSSDTGMQFNLFGDSNSEDEIHETSSRERMFNHQKRRLAKTQRQQKAKSKIASKAKVDCNQGRMKGKTHVSSCDNKSNKLIVSRETMAQSPAVVKPTDGAARNTTDPVKDSKSAVDNDDHDFCCICLDKFSEPKVLHKCSHKFCTECIEQQFRVKPVCPVCFVAYGVVTGNQPDGWMDHRVNRTRLPGYDDTDCIIVSYGFDDGIQTEEHPNPGVPYCGTSRSGYLPNNAEGQKVLKLLQIAFKRRLVFTVGRSRTTGADNVVTWNDIHHKTSPTGGQQGFGYPDPTYLRRVQEELAAFGVTEESLNEANE